MTAVATLLPDRAVLRARVLAEAASWVGTPFVHHGGVKGVGVDCAFSLIRIFHAAGLIPDIDPGYYPRGPFVRDDRYVRWLLPYVVLRKGRPEPADIALFWVPPRQQPAQSAIVIEWPTRIYFAHQEEGFIESAATRDWIAPRFHSAWTVKGLA